MFRWGVLGASSFAMSHMIPAMQAGRGMKVVAIASRARERAAAAAAKLGIARTYDSYDELLADSEIDAVYIPLPNHLHVLWSIRAAEAGKHVLCEKPVALDAAEARRLIEARDRCRVLIQEAAMVRAHPRWLAVRDLLRAGKAGGKIGDLRALTAVFAYRLRSRDNVRYVREWGGGTLLDVGFYPVTIARFCFEEEPVSVAATLERDPETGVDRLISGLLRFPRGQATFTCGMELAPYQHVEIFGSQGRLDLELAFTPVRDAPTHLTVDTSPHAETPEPERVDIEACNQYTLLAEDFATAAASGAPAPVPLEDSVKNMAVLDALARSSESGRWEAPDA
jgi:predicted dehydrogenase